MRHQRIDSPVKIDDLCLPQTLDISKAPVNHLIKFVAVKIAIVKNRTAYKSLQASIDNTFNRLEVFAFMLLGISQQFSERNTDPFLCLIKALLGAGRPCLTVVDEQHHRLASDETPRSHQIRCNRRRSVCKRA